MFLRNLGTHRAPARLHHRDRRGEVHFGEPTLELREIMGHDRLDVSINDRGARAFELLDLGEDIG